MMKCDRCRRETDRAYRHREYGVTVTHRVTRWLCRDCHPMVPGSAHPTGDDTDADGRSPPVLTDGGTAACPHCASGTVNVQGVHDCTDCGWTSQ